MAIEITSVQEPRRLRGWGRSSSGERGWNAPRPRLFARLLKLSAVVLLVSFVAALAFLIYSYRASSKLVDERLASGYLTSRAGIYAAPRVLRTGQNFSRERLREVLRRAGYVDGEASEVWSGRFRVESGGVVIQPRRTPHAVAAPDSAQFSEVRVEFDGRERIAAITGDGAALASFTLEPEALSNDASMKRGTRAALAYRDIPPVVAQAVLAIEDRRFFEHRGLDPTGIARAVRSWAGTDAGDDARLQGGSTITQQLVKNTYLTPERTLRRKFNEAVLAVALERRLSKEDIFALYCNEIYLGQRGALAVRGLAQAAHAYFGKDLKDLSLAEAATIAGMIKGPSNYAPDRHAERSTARRNTVLEAMLREGFITREQAEAAMREPLTVAPPSVAEGAAAPYFVDYVNRVAESDAEPSADGAPRDLRIYTTIDLELQQLAEAALRRQLDHLEKVYRGGKRPQAALVALDPRTGQVLAMVGGRSYGESQLNRATDARRQPGSVFKPFVYTAALENGISPTSISDDAPRVFQYDYRSTYRPANYGGSYSMRPVTLRTGLVRSLNVVTVDVAMRAGLEQVANVAERFGLPKPEAYPALALGTTEATPLEIASAYASFANGGSAVRPTAIVRSVGGEAHAFDWPGAIAPRQIIRPSTAYMMTDMLMAVVNQGTARAARGALRGTAVAGKTGTSRDGWFVGYTPNLVCVVWVGFDDNSQLGLTGAESALPAWVEFVKGAVTLRPELGGESFPRPGGVLTVEIDPDTGLLASPSCPQRERIAVTGALQPTGECYLHAAHYPSNAPEGVEDFIADNSPTVAQTDDANRTMAALTTATLTRPHTPAATLPRPASIPASTEVRFNAPQQPPPATQVEASRDGRSRLTNAMRVVVSQSGLNR